MLKRTGSILIATLAVLLLSSTLVTAAPRTSDESLFEDSNLELRVHRGARVPVPAVGPLSTSEPGDDDAPNREGTTPEVDDGKEPGAVRLWSFRKLGTGIRLQLLKYFSALR